MRLGVFLLLVVSVFYGNSVLSFLTGVDRTLIFYIGQGMLGFVAFMFLSVPAPRFWRWVCYFAAANEFMVAVCGVAYIAKPVVPSLWENLADAQTGLPVSWIGFGVSVFLACIVQELIRGSDNRKR